MDTILILEPDFVFLDFLVELLNENGFRTLASQNEQLGLQLAESHIPDLIICDITKTGLNGYKLLSTLRKISVTRKIPCLFLTREGTNRNSPNAMELRSDNYLDDSCTIEEFIEAIEVRLGGSKQAA